MEEFNEPVNDEIEIEIDIAEEAADDYAERDLLNNSSLPVSPKPINWHLLRAHEAEEEWFALNRWVNQLRRTYGLPASVVPPYWHRHWELVWELSALHTHWLCSYDPEQDGSGPIAWHTDFQLAQERLRDWVATCGTRLDRDRPTRLTTWPGEEPQPSIEDEVIPNRLQDFIEFVAQDAAERQRIEDETLEAAATFAAARAKAQAN